VAFSEPDLLDAPACPFLGLAVDARTRFTFPHPDHRCSAGPRPSAVAQAYQARYCLTVDFASCDLYRARVPDADGTSGVTGAGMPRIVHVFRQGESLARIAAVYGVTVEQIVAANNLVAPFDVSDGRRLVIPVTPPSTPGAPPAQARSG